MRDMLAILLLQFTNEDYSPLNEIKTQVNRTSECARASKLVAVSRLIRSRCCKRKAADENAASELLQAKCFDRVATSELAAD